MRKLMWFAVGFLLAALIGMYCLWGNAYLAATVAAALGLALCIALRPKFKKIRVALAVMLGCVIGFGWMWIFDSIYLALPRACDDTLTEMTVTATDYSTETDYGSAVEGVCFLNGRVYAVRVYLPKTVQLQPGDRLSGRYRLQATLPGCSAESDHSASEHIFLRAKCARTPDLDMAEKLPWYGYPAAARHGIRQLLRQTLPQSAAGFSTALLIGDKTGIDYETDTALKLSGIRHIIAVSGLHVTILFSAIYFLVGKKRLPALLIGLPVLFFFAAVAGFSPSILRACLMHSLMVAAMLFEKEYDGPTALAFAVLVMLFLNPWTVKSVGFQLSVSCMAGIFLFAAPIQTWFMQRHRLGRWKGKRRKLAYWFSSGVAVSLGANILVTPLSAYYFGVVSLVSPITNLLTLWLITYLFYGLILLCLAATVWLPFAKLIGLVLAELIRIVLGIAKVLSSFALSAVYTQSGYMLWWLVLVYLLLAAFLLMKKKPVAVLACCGMLGLCLALSLSWLEPQWDECRVSVLDVGQGQCILLQSGGKAFLVDCGGDTPENAADAAASELLGQGIFRLDGLILTHYDADHAAGAAHLMSRVPTQALFLPTCADGGGIADALQAMEQSILIDQKTVLSYDGATVTLIPSENADSDNESGLCILFQTENCDILITGDRSAAGERALLRQMELPQLDVLIVGHHGSKSATSWALLEQTAPKYAIISVGENNSFGHPAQETLQRLEEADCKIYRTDLHGKVIFRR